MRRLLLLVAVGSLLLGRSIDWLDRPIRNGDRFEPLGACRVRSLGDAWLFRPNRSGGGEWTRVAVAMTTPEGLIGPRPVPWYRYDGITWEVGGGDYRLRIGQGGAPGVVTGPVSSVDGAFD